MPSVCLAYKPYAGVCTKFFCMLKNKFLLHRMPAYAAVGEHSWNVYNLYVHLPFQRVQRMTDFVHMLVYTSAIRNSVTGLLDITHK